MIYDFLLYTEENLVVIPFFSSSFYPFFWGGVGGEGWVIIYIYIHAIFYGVPTVKDNIICFYFICYKVLFVIQDLSTVLSVFIISTIKLQNTAFYPYTQFLVTSFNIGIGRGANIRFSCCYFYIFILVNL